MSRILDKDWFRVVMMALILIGISITVLGAAQFGDALFKKQDRIDQKDRVLALGASDASAQVLFAADVEIGRLSNQQSNSMIFGGAGLTILAIGWIGYDIVRSHQRKFNEQNRSTAESVDDA